MTKNTRIYNRFTGYSTYVSTCEYCLHCGGKKRPCQLDKCCCMEDRTEVALGEYRTATHGSLVISKGKSDHLPEHEIERPNL